MHKNKAFTLIELLVVIAIIGLLASIVLVSVNKARIKARDAKRQAEIQQLALVLQMYYDDNNSFPSNAGCKNGWCCLGNGDSGTCWWSSDLYHGSTALDNALSPTYISKIPDDPLNKVGYYGDAYMYRLDGDTATLHWGIENCSPTAEKDCLNGSLGNWGGNGIGCNYYCLLQVK